VLGAELHVIDRASLGATLTGAEGLLKEPRGGLVERTCMSGTLVV
jgi:hypothetical protein